MNGLTNNAKEELLRIIAKQQVEDSQSQILPNPSYVGNFDTPFLDGLTGYSIIKVIKYKNVELVFLNSANDSIIRVFDSNRVLKLTVDKQNTSGTLEPLFKFIDVKINTVGTIYGLLDKDDKTHFFEFSNFLEYIDLLTEDQLEQELSYSIIFDIETEITKDNTGVDLDVPIGSSLFSALRNGNPTDVKYDFNQEQDDQNSFAFVIEDKTNKNIRNIKFITDTGQITPQEADWVRNEIVNLSQGGTGAGTFDGISQLGILTGERNISATETSLGSIALSTEKDSGTAVEVPFSVDINTTNPLVFSGASFSKDGVLVNGRQSFVPPDTIVANATNFFNDWLQKIQNIINSNPSSIDYSGKIIINSKFNNQETLNINLNKNLIDQLLNSTKKDMIIKRQYNVETFSNQTVEVTIFFKYILELDSQTIDLTNIFLNKKFQFPLNSDFEATINNINYIGVNLGTLNLGSSNSVRFINANVSIDISESINANGTRLQQTIGANTSSQILIEKVSGQDETVYKVIQSENNSFNGTAPVFLNFEKFYIPLKKRETNQYAIFEFTGEQNRQQQEITRFFNDIGDANYTDSGGDSYKTNLLEPTSITKVTVNGVDKPSSEYSLSGFELTILGIKLNDNINIEYKSTQGTPIQLNLTTTTSGEDVFLAGVSDLDELGTTTKAIVGVGDDSFEGTQTSVFGFNLYKSESNIDFNQVAEDAQSITNIKMRHVEVSRQKNLLFISGYNEDYSKEIKWVQIYPDSFDPYTYLPYSNPSNYLSLERLNINKDNLRAESDFDREFLDVASSGKTILANTIIETTDLNSNDRNKVELYGLSNQKIFEFSRSITKEPIENLSINFQLEVNAQRKTTTTQDLPELSTALIPLFTEKNTDKWKDIQVKTLKLTYTDDTFIETDPSPYLTIDTTGINPLLKFGIYLRNVSDKTPSKLELILNNGIIIESVDLLNNPCSEDQEITFNIEIKDTEDLFPFFRWDIDPWDSKPWEGEQ